MKGLVPLFGSSLKDLILDDRRCGVCHMDPLLGVPSMVICMLSFLTLHADTPGLFRTKIAHESYASLKHSLEAERGIPKMEAMSVQENVRMVHIVAYTLLQWLSELPDSLLGLPHYYALQACQDVEEDTPRIRNLSLLILESPWYHQPLLSKLLLFLSLCLQPHNSANGLDIVTISVLFTPFLFRRNKILPTPHAYRGFWGSYFSSLSFDLESVGKGVERDEEVRSFMSIAAAGKTSRFHYLVSFLLPFDLNWVFFFGFSILPPFFVIFHSFF